MLKHLIQTINMCAKKICCNTLNYIHHTRVITAQHTSNQVSYCGVYKLKTTH